MTRKSNFSIINPKNLWKKFLSQHAIYLLNKIFQFIIEKFDFLVKIPPEKEVLWTYSFRQEWKFFILPFLKNMVSGLGNFSVFWPFRGTVWGPTIIQFLLLEERALNEVVRYMNKLYIMCPYHSLYVWKD